MCAPSIRAPPAAYSRGHAYGNGCRCNWWPLPAAPKGVVAVRSSWESQSPPPLSSSSGSPARTYLKSIFPTPSFPMLFHVHGALFTAWMLLFVLQATLVAARRTSLHRRIGLIGRFLVVPMLITGSLAAVAAARGQAPISAAVARGDFAMALLRLSPSETMVIPLTTMLLFWRVCVRRSRLSTTGRSAQALHGTRHHFDAAGRGGASDVHAVRCGQPRLLLELPACLFLPSSCMTAEAAVACIP